MSEDTQLSTLESTQAFQLKRYYVCYLDILGFRDKLFKGLDGTFPLTEEALKEKQRQINNISSSVNILLDSLATLHRGFKDKADLIYDISAKDLERRGYDATTLLLPREVFISQAKKVHVGIQQFSDSTLLYIPIENGMEEIVDEMLASWMIFLAGWTIGGMCQDFVFRGAITSGFGWEIRESCLTGPVVDEAYRMESQIAKYPRIVMSDSVVDRFRFRLDCAGKSGLNTGELATPFRMVYRDTDGVYMLDFLSSVAEENFKTHNGITSGDWECILSGISDRISLEYRRFVEEKNYVLAERYWHLLSYIVQKRAKLPGCLEKNGECSGFRK